MAPNLICCSYLVFVKTLGELQTHIDTTIKKINLKIYVNCKYPWSEHL
jgi:hypothetical protein